MPRIDLLTAQMRQRSVSRVSLSADERMKLFGPDDKFLGNGAALSGQVVGEILSQIAPAPLNGTAVSFPYSGRDGQFEISVAPGGQSFEVRALSFAPDQSATASNTSSQNAPLQTHVEPQTQTQTSAAPSTEVEWFYFQGEQQVGPQSPAQIKTLIRQGQIKPDTLLWCAGMTDWQTATQTEFRTMLPALPVAPAAGASPFGSGDDAANTWFYRSPTGQSVPLDRAALVAKIKGKSLSPETLVWHEGMTEWQSASSTELARDLSGAPIAVPSGAGVGAGRPASSGPFNLYGGGDPNNNSGEGWEAEVPKKARGLFNVGACLFPFWWCRAHNLDAWATGIVVLNVSSRWIPFVGFIKIPLCIGLGIMGNRIGWRMRRFNDVEDFRKCQFLWGAISGGIWGAILLVAFAFGFFTALQNHPSIRPSSPSSSTSQPFGNGPSGSGSSSSSD